MEQSIEVGLNRPNRSEGCVVASTTDQWGCAVSTDAHENALIEQVISGYVTMAPGIDKLLRDLGSGGPMSRALLAMMLTQSHRPRLMKTALELSLQAKHDVDSDVAGEVGSRERSHICAAVAWCSGQIDEAIDAFGQILVDHPTDILAIRARYLLAFGRGRIADMLDTITSVRPGWDDTIPLASYLDGMEAFALEEQGEYRQAENLGRGAVERNETDLWAIHSVAHVLEMERRRDEGVSWLDGRTEVLESGGGFGGHIWWHQALALLDLGRFDEVLDLYDRRVYPDQSTEGLDLSNAVSLLARIEIEGGQVGDRWQALAEPVQVRQGQHSHPFNDTHFALALAKAGETEAARAHLAGMGEWASRVDDADQRDTAAMVLNEVGLAVGQGLVEYGAGRPANAVTALGPVEDKIWMLGGSNAQRGLYSLILADANALA